MTTTYECMNRCGTSVDKATIRFRQDHGMFPNSLMALGWFVRGDGNFCPGCAKHLLETHAPTWTYVNGVGV